MTLLIDDPEFDQAVRELAAVTGEAEEQSVRLAVQERLERLSRQRSGAAFANGSGPQEYVDRVLASARSIAAELTPDSRTHDQIIGYDENGLPA